MKKWSLIFVSFLALVILLTACNEPASESKSSNTDVTATESSTNDSKQGANNDEEIVPEQLVLPIANEEVELSIYVGNAAASEYPDMRDNPIIKRMMEETGLKLTFINPPENDDGTFFNTTLASGKYPDLFFNNFNTYPGGPDGAVEDGILINPNELIQRYAPTFLSWVEEKGPAFSRAVKSDSGMYVALGGTFSAPISDNAFRGMVARKDWLDELGIQPPQTIEEYEAYLVALKEKKNIEVPFVMNRIDEGSVWLTTNLFSSAYGVTQRDYFVDQKQVKYGPIEEGYRSYLELLHKWYEKGLIDKDFPSRTIEDSYKVFVNGGAGLVAATNPQLRQFLTLGQLENPDFDILPLAMPVVEKGQALHHISSIQKGGMGGINLNKTIFISSASKHPVEAMKFIEYLHQPHVLEMTAWGLKDGENPTYTVDSNGTKKFTDFMEKNPDRDFPTARRLFTLGTFQMKWDQEMEVAQYSHPVNLKAFEVWTANNDGTGRLPAFLSLTADESREAVKLTSAIQTYADEMFYKFVLGIEPLENYDKFVETVKQMGVVEAIAIYQNAYERYLQR